MSEELRQFPRAPVRLRVEYESQNAFFADYTSNLSRGGVFIQSEKPLPVGTAFRFTIRVPERESPFELNGKVQWVNQPGRDDAEPAGMGVAFQWDDDAAQEAFTNEAERLMRDSLGDELYERLLRKES